MKSNTDEWREKVCEEKECEPKRLSKMEVLEVNQITQLRLGKAVVGSERRSSATRDTVFYTDRASQRLRQTPEQSNLKVLDSRMRSNIPHTALSLRHSPSA